MRLRKCFCLALCAVLSSLIAFSGMSGLSVSAASFQTVTLTTAQTLSLFGNEIQAEYFSTDGVYKPLTLNYESSGSIDSETQSNPYGVSLAGRQYITYYCRAPQDIDVTPSTMRVSIQTSVDLSGVHYIDTAFLQLSNIDFATILQSSYPNNYWYTSNGYYCASYQPDNSDLFGYVTNNYNLRLSVIPVFFNSDNDSFSFGYVSASNFNNYQLNGGYIYFCIVCPIISEDWVISGNSGAGSGSESSGSGSESGAEQQDLTESGPLSWIGSKLSGLLSGILDGLRGLFVPSQDALDLFQTDMSDMLSDHLGGLYDAVDLISEQAAGLTDVSGLEFIDVPQVDIPLMSTSLRLGGDSWRIPLKISDSRFAFVYTAVAFIIDFIFTAAFVNMCRRKLELFLHPDAEVIDDDS